jgi:hypothetical protein
MFLSDDQVLCMTLLPYYDNIHCINDKDIEYLKDSNIIDKNKKELFNVLKDIEKKNIKVCKYCNKSHVHLFDLKKHIILECFYNEMNKLKKDNNNIKNFIVNNNEYNNCDINSNNNNNNNNNNINIIFEKKTPVPFDEDWDISKISKKEKSGLMVSQYMYTELLEEILKNDINLNVIIDKEKESGMVYKNDIDRYIQMKLKDIIEKTMYKLNSHLTDINQNDDKTYNEIIKFSRQMITKKYIDFKDNDKIQDGVTQCVSEIYENKKKDAIKIAKYISKEQNVKSGY